MRTNYTEHRKRDIQVKFRLTKQEYQAYQKQLQQEGITGQEFFLHAIYNTPVIDKKTVLKLSEMHIQLKDIQMQARGMGTNLNQMARVANREKNTPSGSTLNAIGEAYNTLAKEVAKICRSLSPLIRNQTPKQP